MVTITITIWNYFWGGSNILLENQLCQLAYSETVVHMQTIRCISKCVLGFSFDFCSLGIAVVSLWGEKVDLPKIDSDVLTWIILAFENLWETFGTILGAGKNIMARGAWSLCCGLSSILGIEWIFCGVSPVWPSSIWTLGHTLIWLTLSLIDGLVVLALDPLGRACICCLTTEFSIE